MNWKPIGNFKGFGMLADIGLIRRRALIFFSILGFGSLIQYGYGFVLYYFFNYSYPYTSPLFLPEDRFMDFSNPVFWSKPGETASYTAFTFLFAKGLAQIIDFSQGRLFGRFSTGGIVALCTVVGIFLLCLGGIAKQVSELVASHSDSKLKRFCIFSGAFVAIAISYPSIFAIDRGNYILIAFVFLYLFQKYFNRSFPSGLFLATAISVKQYLALLLLPGFLKRDFKLVFATCCFLLLENVMAALILSNDFSSFFNYLGSFYRPEVLSWWRLAQRMGWNSHFLNLVYALILPVIYVLSGADKGAITASLPLIDKFYSFFVFLPGIMILPVLISKRTTDIELAFFYTLVTIILLTPFIGNYSLILLFVFVPHLLVQPSGSTGTLTLILLACALMPKHYITLFEGGQMRVTLQSIINPILLVSLLVNFIVETTKKD